MSSIEIWLETAHHAAFRIGGWAFVRKDEEIAGQAGGATRIGPEAAALSAVIAALAGSPPGAAITIRSASPQVLALAPHLAGAADAPPENDLPLWAQLQTATAGHAVSILAVAIAPKTPSAFAKAWADLAFDKAKAAGAFKAAIPKSNLGKAFG